LRTSIIGAIRNGLALRPFCRQVDVAKDCSLNPDDPLARKPIVGASLLANLLKFFASKLAPTGREFSNEQSGLNMNGRY
jgi:hypothetical protein